MCASAWHYPAHLQPDKRFLVIAQNLSSSSRDFLLGRRNFRPHPAILQTPTGQCQSPVLSGLPELFHLCEIASAPSERAPS